MLYSKGKLVAMRGNLYYFHGYRQHENIEEMSSMIQFFENGTFVMLEDRPFGQEFEEDFHQYVLVQVQPVLYYRRQYKEPV